LVGVPGGYDDLLWVLVAVAFNACQVLDVAEEDLLKDYGVVAGCVEPCQPTFLREPHPKELVNGYTLFPVVARQLVGRTDEQHLVPSLLHVPACKALAAAGEVCPDHHPLLLLKNLTYVVGVIFLFQGQGYFCKGLVPNFGQAVHDHVQSFVGQLHIHALLAPAPVADLLLLILHLHPQHFDGLGQVLLSHREGVCLHGVNLDARVPQLVQALLHALVEVLHEQFLDVPETVGHVRLRVDVQYVKHLIRLNKFYLHRRR